MNTIKSFYQAHKKTVIAAAATVTVVAIAAAGVMTGKINLPFKAIPEVSE